MQMRRCRAVVESINTNKGVNPREEEEEEATPSAGIGSARYIGYPWPVMALVYMNLAYHELFIVPRALGSPRPTDDKPSAIRSGVG
jgi:hypothetical protein